MAVGVAVGVAVASEAPASPPTVRMMGASEVAPSPALAESCKLPARSIVSCGGGDTVAGGCLAARQFDAGLLIDETKFHQRTVGHGMAVAVEHRPGPQDDGVADVQVDLRQSRWRPAPGCRAWAG